VDGELRAYQPCPQGHCTKVCGGPGNVFFEAESMTKNVEWTYVGSQKGDYECAPDYNYVGPGHGAWEKELRTTYVGWQMRKVWIYVILAMLLAGTAYACYRIFAWHSSSIAAATATGASLQGAPGRPAARPAVAYNTGTYGDGAYGPASYSYTSSLAPVVGTSIGSAPPLNNGISNNIALAPSPPWSTLTP